MSPGDESGYEFAAPFRDMGERTPHSGAQGRNNSKGNVLTNDAAAPAEAPVKWFSRSD
jgi:hypothetical protein